MKKNEKKNTLQNITGLAGCVAGLKPVPDFKPNSADFPESEPITTPMGKEFLAKRVVQLWGACSEKDRKRILKLLEKCAMANQGEVKW